MNILSKSFRQCLWTFLQHKYQKSVVNYKSSNKCIRYHREKLCSVVNSSDPSPVKGLHQVNADDVKGSIRRALTVKSGKPFSVRQHGRWCGKRQLNTKETWHLESKWSVINQSLCLNQTSGIQLRPSLWSSNPFTTILLLQLLRPVNHLRR